MRLSIIEHPPANHSSAWRGANVCRKVKKLTGQLGIARNWFLYGLVTKGVTPAQLVAHHLHE